MGRALWLVPLSSLVFACGRHEAPKTPPPPAPALGQRIEVPGRPHVAAVVRAGDPASAASAYAVAEGVSADAGDAPAVAVGALLEARLAPLHPRVSFDPGAIKVSVLVDDPKQAEDVAARIAGAFLAPYAAADTERAVVERKLAALSALPPARGALALCEGRLRAPVKAPTAADVESFRAAIATRARVAFGAVGSYAIADGVARGLGRSAAWPEGVAPNAPPLPAEAALEIATPVAAAGRALVHVAAWGAGDRAAGRADRLASSESPLGARLAAADASAAVVGVHLGRLGDRACTSLTFGGASSSLFGTMALARRELALSEGEANAALPTAPDPLDAAELGAAASLPVAPPTPAAIGARVELGGDPRAKTEMTLAPFATLDRDVAAAEATLGRPVVDARTALEPGQREIVVLLASPCGTGGETKDDAGLGALALSALPDADDVATEPWVATDGLGLLARSAARPGESAAELGRRVGDALARAFFRGVPTDVSRARAKLSESAEQGLVHLATTLAPAHPSWIAPLGTADALLHGSDGLVTTRLDAIRRGPLRAAALVSGTREDADATIDALDRWAPRTFGGAAPACDEAPLAAPKPGSYVAAGPHTQAWVALAITKADLAAAEALAALLDGELLPRALAGLVREASTRVVGGERAPFFVVHLDAPDGSLDAAVAQTRVLLDRLRAQATDDEARSAIAALASRRRAARMDPRRRVIDLFRGETAPPTAAAVRAFAATLHDDALIVAAVRPPRPAQKPVKP